METVIDFLKSPFLLVFLTAFGAGLVTRYMTNKRKIKNGKNKQEGVLRENIRSRG
jgi:hypothetical protein